MFKIKIKEKKYTVYGEYEYNFICRNKVVMIGIPNFYDLKVENNGYLRITNNEPIIFPLDDLINLNCTINEVIKLGYPIDINMYNILYEKHLEDAKVNLDEINTKKMEIENDLNYVKESLNNKTKILTL